MDESSFLEFSFFFYVRNMYSCVFVFLCICFFLCTIFTTGGIITLFAERTSDASVLLGVPNTTTLYRYFECEWRSILLSFLAPPFRCRFKVRNNIFISRLLRLKLRDELIVRIFFSIFLSLPSLLRKHIRKKIVYICICILFRINYYILK